jgi:hypothetical protein
MTRLDTIATRQRRSRARDLVFVAFLAIAAAISATSVTTAVAAASTPGAAR